MCLLTCSAVAPWFNMVSGTDVAIDTRIQDEETTRRFGRLGRRSTDCRRRRVATRERDDRSPLLAPLVYSAMPGGDHTRRPPLLLGGENTSTSAMPRAKLRVGPSSSSMSSSIAAMDESKRTTANQLRELGANNRRALAAGRSIRASPTASAISSKTINTISEASVRAESTSAGGNTSSSPMTARGSAATLQKRIGDLVKRAQPHTIVQTYDKILRAVQLDAQLVVNGEALLSDAAVSPSLQSGWKHRGREGEARDVASGFSDPRRGRFHYALGFRFSHVDPALSLSTITDIAVCASPTPLSTGTCRPCWFIPLMSGQSAHPVSCSTKRVDPATAAGRTKLSIKAWRLVVETPARVGLALYELPLCVSPKTIGSSSILALVWTRDHARLEVAVLFAQLHVPELLSQSLIVSPSRPSLVVPLPPVPNNACDGDADGTTGLRGFTMALTLRTLERVIWEREWYQVDLPKPSKEGRSETATTSRHATVHLLDEHGAFRDRARYAEGSVGLDIQTDAMTIVIDSVIIADFCAWEESAIAPVWGFSRPVRVVPLSSPAASSLSDTLGGDFTLTAAGRTHELLQLSAEDAAGTGNQVTVQLVKTRAKTTGEADRILIKQVDVTMGVAFLNAAFGTSY